MKVQEPNPNHGRTKNMINHTKSPIRTGFAAVGFAVCALITSACGSSAEVSTDTTLTPDATVEAVSTTTAAADAFDDVEESIIAFESGDLEVPARGECGNHFNVTFDPEDGFPNFYNTLGPCDDGVSVRVGIIPLEQ